jgi:hypothetical protein
LPNAFCTTSRIRPGAEDVLGAAAGAGVLGAGVGVLGVLAGAVPTAPSAADGASASAQADVTPTARRSFFTVAILSAASDDERHRCAGGLASGAWRIA